MSEDSIFNVVIGTAGHIDHGKSSIVRRLTGVDPDRLPEERNRGLTIDLGFAPMTLPNGERVGIIDVPGHERFIKNMVAGASGIDLVVLVVAADDSVMPQTREHLDIMTLLGLQRGCIVVNKIDLVEEDLVDLVEEEVRELTAGTFLDGAPVYRVSAETGAGIEEFRTELFQRIEELPGRGVEGVFRMPIQRVFSAKGHGTVVTGVPVTGQVQMGDRLEILPLGQEGRVRSLQAYKVPVDRARAGHSTAINIGDIDYRDAHRGMVAATPGYFRATDMLEVKMQVLPTLRQPLRHQMAVRFHTGTVEVVGKLYLLDKKHADPGEETFAQFRLAEPIVVAPGDRYVFRQESPMMTLGGGEVLDRSAWRLKTGKQHVLESLERKEAALGSPQEYVLSILEEAPFELVERKEIAHRAGMPLDDTVGLLKSLEEDGQLLPIPGGAWLTRHGIERGGKRVQSALDACYKADPYRVRVPKLEINQHSRLPVQFLDRLLQRMAESGEVELQAGGTVSQGGRELSLGADEEKAYEIVQAAYLGEKFSPPRLEDLADQRGESLQLLERMHNLLVDQEEIVRVTPEVTLHKEAVDEGITRLRRLFADEGPFSAARAKDVLETSRKFAIPFLEYLDRLKVTRRVGNTREVVAEQGE